MSDGGYEQEDGGELQISWLAVLCSGTWTMSCRPGRRSDNAGRDVSKRGSMSLGPRKGVFSPSTETRQAVNGEDRKGAAVPSPHPKSRMREDKRRTIQCGKSYQSVIFPSRLLGCTRQRALPIFAIHDPMLQKNDHCSAPNQRRNNATLQVGINDIP